MRKTKFERELDKALSGLRQDLEALDDRTWTCEQVVQIFVNRPEGQQVLESVFWELDTRPGQFSGYQRWHPKLRSTRNHPVDGPRLFAAIRKEPV